MSIADSRDRKRARNNPRVNGQQFPSGPIHQPMPVLRDPPSIIVVASDPSQFYYCGIDTLEQYIGRQRVERIECLLSPESRFLLLADAVRRGVRYVTFLNPGSTMNVVVVNPDGSFFKCWEGVSLQDLVNYMSQNDPHLLVGHLLNTLGISTHGSPSYPSSVTNSPNLCHLSHSQPTANVASPKYWSGSEQEPPSFLHDTQSNTTRESRHGGFGM